MNSCQWTNPQKLQIASLETAMAQLQTEVAALEQPGLDLAEQKRQTKQQY
jgi:hypothetical protein